MRFKNSILFILVPVIILCYFIFKKFEQNSEYYRRDSGPLSLSLSGENLIYGLFKRGGLPLTIVHNLNSGISTALDLPGYILLNPKSTDEGKIFISAYPSNIADTLLSGNDPEFLLLLCDINAFNCKKLFSFNRTIDFPIRLKSGSIIFSSKAPVIVRNEKNQPRVLWRDSNFYRNDISGVNARLTEFKEYSIKIAGILGERLIFNMQKSPRRPDGTSLNPWESSIFAANLTDNDSLYFDENLDTLKPYITIGSHGDSSAILSMDGKYISLHSQHTNLAVNNKNRGNGSDIVIIESEKLEEKYRIEPKKYNHLLFKEFDANKSLYYIEWADGKYNIRNLDLGTSQIKNIRELDDLEKIKPRTLTISRE